MKKDKDQLENFIRENLDDFNQEMPSAELWKKINPVAPKESNVIKLTFFQKAWRVAAALILLIGVSSILLYITQPDNNITIETANENTSDFSLRNISPEYAEIQEYYEEQMTSKISEIKKHNLDDDILTELESFDTEFDVLEEEFKSTVDNQKVIDAIIQNYRIQLDNLDNIIDHINHIDNLNDHEKNSDNIIVFV